MPMLQHTPKQTGRAGFGSPLKRQRSPFTPHPTGQSLAGLTVTSPKNAAPGVNGLYDDQGHAAGFRPVGVKLAPGFGIKYDAQGRPQFVRIGARPGLGDQPVNRQPGAVAGQALAPQHEPDDFRDSQYYDSIAGLDRRRAAAIADADLQERYAGADRDATLQQLMRAHQAAQQGQAQNAQRQGLFFSSTFDRQRANEGADYGASTAAANQHYQQAIDAAAAARRDAGEGYTQDALAALYGARDRGLDALAKAPAPDSGVPDPAATADNTDTVLAAFKAALAGRAPAPRAKSKSKPKGKKK